MGEILVDRRKASRIPVQVPVGSDHGWDHTWNLSPQGMYVETGRKLALGTALEFVLSVPDGQAPLPISGRIVRTGNIAVEPRGFGVAFTSVNPAARDRLTGYLQHFTLRSSAA
jgi:Tfp pilus assembly protein PilZ